MGPADRPEKKLRKVRTTFTPKQKEILFQSYAKDPCPSAGVKRDLAKSLDLRVQTVEIWFKNRRANLRKVALLRSNGIPAPPASMESINPRERRQFGPPNYGFHRYPFGLGCPPGSVIRAAAHVQSSPEAKASLSDSSLASTSSYRPAHGDNDNWHQSNPYYNLASSTPLTWSNTYHPPQQPSICTQQFQSYSFNCSQPSSGLNQNGMPATQSAPQTAHGHSDYSHNPYNDRPEMRQVSPLTSAFTPVTSTNTGPPVNSSAGYRDHSSYEPHDGFNHQSQNQQDWCTNQNQQDWYTNQNQQNWDTNQSQQNWDTDQNQFSHSSHYSLPNHYYNPRSY